VVVSLYPLTSAPLSFIMVPYVWYRWMSGGTNIVAKQSHLLFVLFFKIINIIYYTE
jgi:hypothetical protein